MDGKISTKPNSMFNNMKVARSLMQMLWGRDPDQYQAFFVGPTAAGHRGVSGTIPAITFATTGNAEL